MLMSGVIERAERVIAVRADPAASAASLTSAMRSVAELRSFLAAADADLAVRLRAVSSFPEPEIAAVSRESLSAASTVIERGETLAVVAGLAEALDDARVTAGHVDAVTRGAKSLEPSQRDALFGRIEGLVEEAGGLSVAEFARRVRREADEVRADDGMARLERQRRATSMSTWTDDEGMWNVRGRFDPVTALSVSSALERAVEALF
ncbi:MAG: HNH endonuclease, partial [Ilumatobacter sp.]